MAGRGRFPHRLNPARGPLPGPGPLHGPVPFGPGMRSHMGPGLDHIEHKLAVQHAEIQRLLTENQRLAATHIALRQEFAAVNQELQHMQQVMGGLQVEKEQHVRALVEKSAKLEADLHATEPFKLELQKLQGDVQKLAAHRQELTAQLQQATQELHLSLADAQLAPNLKADIDALRQELQRARTAFEYEKKGNTELLEQRQAMEKNLVSLAREVEKLRAELTNSEKKLLGGYNGGLGGGPDTGYPPSNVYADNYGMKQVGAAGEDGSHFGTGPPSWGAYDMQRGAARR